jgi:hypothetical protein
MSFGNVALSKQCAYYGPWSDSPYYYLTTSIEEGTPYPPPGDVLDIPVGLAVLIVRIRVITKLPNSEQSSKGKVKTHKLVVDGDGSR